MQIKSLTSTYREKQPPSAEPKKVSKEDVYAVMQKLTKNGIAKFNSRLVSDKLGLEPDAGRQRVRILMKKLKAGKVVIEQKAAKEKGARKRYVYRLG